MKMHILSSLPLFDIGIISYYNSLFSPQVITVNMQIPVHFPYPLPLNIYPYVPLAAYDSLPHQQLIYL